jgi:hypothetical protein
MTFERLYLLLLVVPPVFWMVFHSHRSHGPYLFLINAFGAALLVSALCLPEFLVRQSKRETSMLADALTSLSNTDLRRTSRRERAAGIRRRVNSASLVL